MKKRIESFKNALNGFVYVWNNEPNFKIHLTISVILILVGLWRGFDVFQWVVITFAIVIVLTMEIINSAIEYTWDHLEPNHHPVVGTIKDVIASSVLVASIGSAIVGILVIFFY